MILETERLILRPLAETDAESIFEYAKDPDVGPVAGWPSHQSVQESRDVIREVLSGPQCYGICLKDDNKAIGAVELILKEHTALTDRDDDLIELGKFVKTLKNVDKFEILPYHTMGEFKWRELGIPYSLEGVKPPTADRVKNAKKLMDTESYQDYMKRVHG